MNKTLHKLIREPLRVVNIETKPQNRKKNYKRKKSKNANISLKTVGVNVVKTDKLSSKKLTPPD